MTALDAGAALLATPSGSRFAETLTVPVELFILRSYGLKPFLLILIMCCPDSTPTDEGVFPAKLPSSSISASGGVEEISSVAVIWPG